MGLATIMASLALTGGPEGLPAALAPLLAWVAGFASIGCVGVALGAVVQARTERLELERADAADVAELRAAAARGRADPHVEKEVDGSRQRDALPPPPEQP